MAKKRVVPSARGKRRAKSTKPLADSRLNLSDIPESTNEELIRARRVGQPVRKS